MKRHSQPCKVARFLLSALAFFIWFDSLAQTFEPSKIDQALAKNSANTGAYNLMLIRNNTLIYEKSFAETSDRILSNTRIKISTASVWLASATILTLVDDGYFTLDTEISKLLPQFKGEKGKITVRQLLAHTGGFPTNSVYLRDKNLTLMQSVDSIAKYAELQHLPGKKFSFGGVSIQIAAAIAEAVTGKSWEQVFHEKIARPCQMTVTDFGKAKSIIIGDGAYASAKDYSNFLRMILSKGMYAGNRVLSDKMIAEMLTDQTGGLPLGYTPYRFRTAQNSRFYGLGVWIERIDPKTNIATEVNGQGARGFTPWLNTCKNIAGVFAVYGDLKTIQPTIDEVKDLLDSAYPVSCNDVSTENLETIKDVAPPSANIIYISFQLNGNAFVNLKLFDPLGNEVLEIVNRSMNQGEHTIPVSTNELPAGVYFYRLKVNERMETKKITIKK